MLSSVKNKIPQEYINKGFADAKVNIIQKPNASDANMMDWTIELDKGKKIKIAKINFEGNKDISSAKLRKKVSKIPSKKDLVLVEF